MIRLSNRLQAVADLVPQGTVPVDVGCDHGYVPVYLVQSGKCERAIACDVNKAPLKSCELLVQDEELEDRIKCVLSDGLDKIEDDYDTVIIAGMGGELIANILSRNESIKTKSLVINPMTHSELVRKWLYDNDFQIDKDIIVSDANHFYSVISAHYTGVKQEACEVDYYLGEIKDFSQKQYFEHLLNYLKNKQKSGVDYSAVINAIEEKL